MIGIKNSPGSLHRTTQVSREINYVFCSTITNVDSRRNYICTYKANKTKVCTVMGARANIAPTAGGKATVFNDC